MKYRVRYVVWGQYRKLGRIILYRGVLQIEVDTEEEARSQMEDTYGDCLEIVEVTECQ